MGFEDRSLVLAGHLVILIAVTVFFFRMIPMAAAARRAEVGYGALAQFPICVMLFAIIAALEAVYYGAARLLLDHGLDLWDKTVVVGLMRLGVAVSLLWHLPAYLRWRGHGGQMIRVRVIGELMVFTALYAGIATILW